MRHHALGSRVISDRGSRRRRYHEALVQQELRRLASTPRRRDPSVEAGQADECGGQGLDAHPASEPTSQVSPRLAERVQKLVDLY